MSIFGSIVGKIFGHANAAPAPETASGGSASSTSGPTASFNNPTAAPTSPGSSTAPAAASAGPVDVAAILTELAGKAGQKLDWRHSIVDLMKLLGLDSSQSARQELAKELHYTGSSDDSATMNVWLHKQVMQKLAENGGKVPDELK